MKAQAAGLPFTLVFSALVSILNTNLSMMGDGRWANSPVGQPVQKGI